MMYLSVVGWEDTKTDSGAETGAATGGATGAATGGATGGATGAVVGGVVSAGFTGGAVSDCLARHCRIATMRAATEAGSATTEVMIIPINSVFIVLFNNT
jgi:hypothetical protein